MSLNKLSDKQREILDGLELGVPTDVGTSQYLNTRQTNYFNPSVIAPAQSFFGLDKRGYIHINSTTWRALNVTKLKEAGE